MSMTMQDRVDAVLRRMGEACRRAGRSPDEVELVAVSKTFGPDAVAEAAACGLSVFGENRVQEAAAKIPAGPGHLRWHLVGHLQRNKAAYAVELFDLIHSVDSVRLLEALDRAADALGKTQRVLVEVNVAGEASKFGVAPEDLPALLVEARRLSRIELAGLMCIPPPVEDLERARPHFRRLRELRDRCTEEQGLLLPELSMGMSHDFEVAIEEGATLVRVGSAIFGERPRPARSEEDT